jgi:uncharacterized protein YdaU (DUF1376 family)
MHYYQFNIGDYQSHTGHLDPIEDIAYRRMLDWCYLHESALPNLPDQIARQIRMRGHEDVIQAVLSEFFILAEEGWYQTRIDEEIKHYHSKVQQASRAGKASAERRINARSTPVQQTNVVRSTDVQPNKKQEPITKNQEKSATKVACPPEVDQQVWDDWLTLRRAKKAPVTATVFVSAANEAAKANITLNDYLKIWCARGSQGMKAEWITDGEKTAAAGASKFAGDI